jgi:tetratricopeptide (TPR) repeat protein
MMFNINITNSVLAAVSLAAIACGGTQVNDKAIRQSDRFYEAAYIAWHDQNDILAAIRHLTRAVAENPANDNAQYLLGTLRLSRGEYKEAQIHLDAALKYRDKSMPAARTETLNSLGVLYLLTKKPQKAVKVLTEAVGEVLNREPWLAMGNLGWAYTELGEYDKAIDILERALFDQPKFCVGLYRLGNVYYLKGDFDKAKESLEGVTQIKEGGCDRMQEAHYLLGMTYLRVENVENAIHSFETCIKINPKSETGHKCVKARADL